MNDVATGSASPSKRAEKTKRYFLDAEGEASPRASLKSVAGRIVFVGRESEPLEFSVDELTNDVKNAAALFGIMTSVTNTVGRADMTLDDMIEAAEARLKSIVEDGRWSAERESGPRTNDLIEAASRWYAEKGKTFSPEMVTKMQARLEAEPDYRASLQRNVAVHFAAIKAERAAERARKAQANATAQDDLEDLV